MLAEIDFSELLIEQVAGIYPAFEEKGLAIVMGEENPVNIKSDIEMVTRIIQNVLRNLLYACKIHCGNRDKRRNGMGLFHSEK